MQTILCERVIFVHFSCGGESKREEGAILSGMFDCCGGNFYVLLFSFLFFFKLWENLQQKKYIF